MYTGETRARKKWVAVLLTWLCPGLGSIYLGRMLRGLSINLLFLVALELFVLLWSLQKFFPLLPFAVFVTGWLVFSTLLALEHVREIDAQPTYPLRAYNHWTIYIVVFLLSFMVPIALTVGFTETYLWRIDPVRSAAMYPGLQPGDSVLVDLTALKKQPAERGDVVAVQLPEQSDPDFLRVVATQGDLVRMEGDTLYVNDEAVARSPLQSEDPNLKDTDDDSAILAMVEHNQGSRYVIAVSPRVFSGLVLPPTQLEADRFFLLSDNRSQIPIQDARAGSTPAHSTAIRDSRNFGALASGELLGKPRYIFWSRAPDGSTRWERIGLRVR